MRLHTLAQPAAHPEPVPSLPRGSSLSLGKFRRTLEVLRQAHSAMLSQANALRCGTGGGGGRGSCTCCRLHALAGSALTRSMRGSPCTSCDICACVPAGCPSRPACAWSSWIRAATAPTTWPGRGMYCGRCARTSSGEGAGPGCGMQWVWCLCSANLAQHTPPDPCAHTGWRASCTACPGSP